MTIVCGIDGCRGGWVAVAKVTETGALIWRRAGSLAALLAEWTPAVTAADIPIGLPDAGPRQCDVAARRLLGPGRGSSVFPAPIRRLLHAHSYQDACRIRLSVDNKKISKQTYAILPKIRETDELMRNGIGPLTQVREVHPEVSFTFLAGGNPMQYSKRKPEGKRERRALLEPLYGPWLAGALSERKLLGCAEDDIVDAFVALWTAERIAQGKAQTLPETPPKDRYGLPMEIVV
jgi:predicted RNase H-like nuclease